MLSICWVKLAIIFSCSRFRDESTGYGETGSGDFFALRFGDFFISFRISDFSLPSTCVAFALDRSSRFSCCRRCKSSWNLLKVGLFLVGVHECLVFALRLVQIAQQCLVVVLEARHALPQVLHFCHLPLVLLAHQCDLILKLHDSFTLLPRVHVVHLYLCLSRLFHELGAQLLGDFPA